MEGQSSICQQFICLDGGWRVGIILATYEMAYGLFLILSKEMKLSVKRGRYVRQVKLVVVMLMTALESFIPNLTVHTGLVL